MRILVIGSGGREHAIAWKLSKSPRNVELFCAPGNAGIARLAKCFPTRADDVAGLADLARGLGIDLTVVGPEVPLVKGIASLFADKNLGIVGPTQAAAQLEGSKIFAKQFMARHRIPTARFVVCQSPDSARDQLKSHFRLPVVVKADGLAAGKGVRIAQDQREFDQAIDEMMVQRVFGDAGSRVVLEEFLPGQEASLMLFTDGKGYRLLAPARDYKRVDTGDRGPNTGGMGSFSTPGLLGAEQTAAICRKIIEPTLEAMNAEGAPFSGVLYVGLMLTAEGPFVVEYNARLGDPETQSVLVRLESDLVDIFESIASGGIGQAKIEWSDDSSVCVVAASGGYPGPFESGNPISGLDDAESVEGVAVFHAGTSIVNGRIATAGGRVLGITARASRLQDARARAYEAIARLSFDRIHYRTDIAQPPPDRETGYQGTS
jgi:phosphoribosylamine--glycine ligase